MMGITQNNFADCSIGTTRQGLSAVTNTRNKRKYTHEVGLLGPTCVEVCSSRVALTGRQKLALKLEKAGHSHAEIAEKMGLARRSYATKLLVRARLARKALAESLAEFLDH